MTAVFSGESLRDCHYLVTGASSGLGRATAQLLAGCGARITAAGRDSARLDELLAGLGGAGHRAAAMALTDADSTASWVRELAEAAGPFTGIFHAAGVESIRPVRLVRQEQLDEVLRATLYAGFGIARAAGHKGVVADGGALLYMSSVAGSAGQAGMTAYSAAKAAIDGLVRALACELAPRSIRVNSLAAGAVQTPMHERITAGATDEVLQGYARNHLLGFGLPADVANAAVFLLGPGSRWITGTTMVVDGGYLCK